MAARTTGPRQDTGTLRGYATPFVNYPFTAETLTKTLTDLETQYKANSTGTRSSFIRSQLKLITDTYSYFANALNELAQANGIPTEAILAAGTATIGEYVPEPFGVLVKGFTYMFTKISAQAQADQAERIQKDQTFYVGQLNQLQALYTGYQAELNRILWLKVFIVGVPAFLLYMKIHKKNDRNTD